MAKERDDSIDPKIAHHLTLYHYPDLDPATNQYYFKVKIPGGGNCGFYSVALALLNIIAQDKLTLPRPEYEQLITAVKDQKGQARKNIEGRLLYFETGNNPDNKFKGSQLKKCVRHMKEILRAFDSGELDTPDAFKTYLIDSSLIPNYGYYFIESMMFVLGPALRQISPGAKESFKPIGAGKVRIEDADGENVDEEQLNLIAGFLNCRLKAYSEDPAHPYFISYEGYSYPEPAHPGDEKEEMKERDRPKLPSVRNFIEIVNMGGIHWDLLFHLDELKKPPFFFSKL